MELIALQQHVLMNEQSHRAYGYEMGGSTLLKVIGAGILITYNIQCQLGDLINLYTFHRPRCYYKAISYILNLIW